MALPEVYYIEESDSFFKSKFKARKEYSLILATSLEPDDNLYDKILDFSAVALRLGSRRWGNRNDGILTFNLNLAQPIVVKAQGPIKSQTINTLHYTFAFTGAKRNCAVGGMAHTPIFRRVSVSDYLSQDKEIGFSLDISLARSGGSNAYTVVDMTSRILKDPAVSGGLIPTVPILGIASAVFEVIRKSFFDSGQAKIIWDETKIQFRGTAGIAYPLKVGRYVFITAKESTDKVENDFRYRGGRLVKIRGRRGELRNLEQFYFDIFAYKEPEKGPEKGVGPS
jgi:hypothetical protein